MVACCAAFWLCVVAFRSRSTSTAECSRFVVGLVLGAAAARCGWALLHLDRIASSPQALLDPAAGFSSLFVPLGPLTSASWGATREARQSFLAEALHVLPLGLAVARLGCLAAGCCGGIALESPLAIAGVTVTDHPVPVYEAAGLLALYLAARRMPARFVVATVLAAFGGLRLLLEPLRAASEGSMAVEIVCSSWIVLGVSLGRHEASRRRRGLRPSVRTARRGAPTRTSASARACDRGP
jgi:hypothetical protein